MIRVDVLEPDTLNWTHNPSVAFAFGRQAGRGGEAPTKSPTKSSRLQRSGETDETRVPRTCSSGALVRLAETHETRAMQLPRWGSRVRIPSSAPGQRVFRPVPRTVRVTLWVTLRAELRWLIGSYSRLPTVATWLLVKRQPSVEVIGDSLGGRRIQVREDDHQVAGRWIDPARGAGPSASGVLAAGVRAGRASSPEGTYRQPTPS